MYEEIGDSKFRILVNGTCDVAKKKKDYGIGSSIP